MDARGRTVKVAVSISLLKPRRPIDCEFTGEWPIQPSSKHNQTFDLPLNSQVSGPSNPLQDILKPLITCEFTGEWPIQPTSNHFKT